MPLPSIKEITLWWIEASHYSICLSVDHLCQVSCLLLSFLPPFFSQPWMLCSKHPFFFFSGTGMLTVSTVFSKGCFWVWSKSGWRGTSEGFEASLRGLGNGPRKATHVLGFQIYLSPDCVKPLCFLASWVPTQSLYSIVSALYADEGPIFQAPMGTYRALCLLRAQSRHYGLVLWL